MSSIYPSLYAGQRFTASLAQSMVPIYAVKAADESVTSSTTLQDDDELQVSVEASAVYEVTGLLIFGADPAGDLKLGWSAPTSATFSWALMGGNASIAATSGSVILDRQTITSTGYQLGGVTANTTIMTARLRGILRVSTTAGTFKLQWAQLASSVNATIMKADSWIRLRRVS